MANNLIFSSVSSDFAWVDGQADVNNVHLRLRKEAKALYSITLEPEIGPTLSPGKDGYIPKFGVD